MSSIFASNGMVLATAMAAVSGTVILLAFRLQKQPTTAVAGTTKFSVTNHPRPCISIGSCIFFLEIVIDFDWVKIPEAVDFLISLICDIFWNFDVGGTKKRVKKKKKVHFAEDVMEPSGNGDEFRKRLQSKKFHKLRTSSSLFKDEGGKKKISMPANRMALYTGILRDRGVQRLAYS
ncbi:hypothetical protein L1887_38271 [Cichorium endivia]|nr:hypothetical protein L1887_38271 [Cichorium endivia]